MDERGKLIVKHVHERPTMIQRDKISAENLVKTINIRENFSKSSDFICLFAKISVSLQFIEVSITKRRNNMCAMRIADNVTSVKK